MIPDSTTGESESAPSPSRLRATVDNPDVNACESGLDANWNERKHLIEQEFELRLKIQESLVKAAPSIEQLRQEERACKAALKRNDEEYESLVVRWTGELFPPRM